MTPSMKVVAVMAVSWNIILLGALVGVVMNVGAGGGQNNPDVEHDVKQAIQHADADLVTSEREIEMLHRLASRSESSLKPACHLAPALHHTPDGNNPGLHWRYNTEINFLNSVDLAPDGSVVIRHPGFYLIYARVVLMNARVSPPSYHKIACKDESTDRVVTTSVVLLDASGQAITAAQDTQASQSAPGTYPCRATFLQSHVNIRDVTRIMLVSNIGANLDTSPHRTYLGMFRT
ncbi:uncharacterized protein LOC124124171 [Haliotis rufescens]|uniref:uncharacterized protein LOC124124171 n=1 Tax=Haliotis rufescens TaxID=6454 RepID=UPI00201EC3A7|nr:uncharacterized protein LOC124124171 [Haliotis rufescens]XP_048242771.1 uncharacterized protein LOC124124171 [Haliotis rufescens]